MGVSPKVQPIYIGSHKTLGYTVLMGVSPKVQPIYAGSLGLAKEKSFSNYHWPSVNVFTVTKKFSF